MSKKRKDEYTDEEKEMDSGFGCCPAPAVFGSWDSSHGDVERKADD